MLRRRPSTGRVDGLPVRDFEVAFLRLGPAASDLYDRLDHYSLWGLVWLETAGRERARELWHALGPQILREWSDPGRGPWGLEEFGDPLGTEQ